MAHEWILVASVSKYGEQWADWACTRCKQKIITHPNADPNSDDFVWSVQGAYACDDQIMKDVMKS